MQDLLTLELATAEDPSTSSPVGCALIQFIPETSAQSDPPRPFNPLFHFDHIGHAKFDQVGVCVLLHYMLKVNWSQYVLVKQIWSGVVKLEGAPMAYAIDTPVSSQTRI